MSGYEKSRAHRAGPEQLVIDLFNRGTPAYPAFPGSKGSDTSRAAAEAIAPLASNWRGKLAKFYADKHPRGFTADEAAKEIGATPFMIRPRVTELSAAGLIEKTGERRRNESSSLSAAVWRASELLLSTISPVSPPLAAPFGVETDQ
ncbi:hypothetical protein IVB16_27475 [Bradyrhizobium sp. 183]|uniref:hypothetical protein n=1 Tax=unclassified Bradyrhizobium TaxID=2631580 RepID=UPI001FFE8297|nr:MULTISPECIES: hypothetical protein [unclassified Bradyrhizobium]UPJ78592.1 hypothetical protein IVB17_27475 [Bradyrhizobium sp. 184]UPJ86387.1 hypothetical protein IVB16_27475 [Bradyrhizobium sp. 183]